MEMVSAARRAAGNASQRDGNASLQRSSQCSTSSGSSLRGSGSREAFGSSPCLSLKAALLCAHPRAEGGRLQRLHSSRQAAGTPVLPGSCLAASTAQSSLVEDEHTFRSYLQGFIAVSFIADVVFEVV